MCFNMVFLCWKTIGDSVIWVAGDQREEFQIRVASEFSLSSCSMIDFIAKGRKIREWFLQLSLPVFSPKIGFSSKRSRITTNGTRISPSQKVPGWFLGNMDSFPGRATYTQSSYVWKEIPHRICTKKSLFQLRPAVEWSNKWEGGSETPNLRKMGWFLNTRECLKNDNIHFTVTLLHVHLIRLKMHDGTIKIIHIIHVLFSKSLSLETYGE